MSSLVEVPRAPRIPEKENEDPCVPSPMDDWQHSCMHARMTCMTCMNGGSDKGIGVASRQTTHTLLGKRSKVALIFS